MIPELDENEEMSPTGSIVLGDGYMLMRPKDKYFYICTALEAEVISNYLATGMGGIGENNAENHVVKLFRWGKLELPTGQLARTAWKEDPKPIVQLRRSRCVKVSPK